MLHKKIEIPKFNFYEIMTKLGSTSYAIEFEDLNKNEIETHKSHYSIINRCDEIETVFTHLNDIFVKKYNIDCELYDNYEEFQTHLDYEIKSKKEKIKENNYFDIIQNEIFEDEIKIKTQDNLNTDQLDFFHKSLEKKYIYEKMVELFEGNIIHGGDNNEELRIDYEEFNNEEEDLNLIKGKSSDLKGISESLKYLCGMCGNEDVMKLRRLIFRAGKGLAVPFFYYPTFNNNSIIFDEKNYFENKQIFLIIINGRQVFEKIRKNIEVLNYETFSITNALRVKNELQNINADISNQIEIIKNTRKVLLDMIRPLTDPVIIKGKKYKCLFSLYRTFCKREKYIYMNLNKCQETSSFYIGDIWVPKTAFENLKNYLNELTKEKDDNASPSFLKAKIQMPKKEPIFQWMILLNHFKLLSIHMEYQGMEKLIQVYFLL